MALYSYIKAQSSSLSYRDGLRQRKVLDLVSLGLGVLGVLLIGQVVLPMAAWLIGNLPGISGGVVSPVVGGVYDSYRPTTWFSKDTLAYGETAAIGPKRYLLSIPKLKIENAVVEVGGEDLKKNLISWPTSAMPGAYGVGIIFGHSELPIFANAKSYEGIFTHIMDLSAGDTILVNYDNVSYKYVVLDKKIIEPTDLSVLEQRFDDAYLELITCVPPGTTWKRGVVRAKLVQI